MNEIIINLLLWNLVFVPIDNVPIGLSLDSDSLLYIEDFYGVGEVELDLYIDVYLDYGLYEDDVNFVFNFQNVDFSNVSYINLQFSNISIVNNYFVFDLDFSMYHEDNIYGWYASESYGLNIYDDYVFTDDVYLGQYNVNIYSLNMYDRFIEIGYYEGLEQGRNEGQGINNVISWFGTIWDALKNLFTLEIAPNVSIGLVFGIPIFIGLLWFLLRALIN